MPEIDRPAPLFTAQDLNGEPVGLGDWRGRPVLLDFWATWCEPCKEEFPAFQGLEEEIPELLVVGVAVGESADQVRDFVEQMGFSFLALPDPRSSIARIYGVTALPTTCLIGPDGVLYRRDVGKIDLAEWRVAITALLGSPPSVTLTPVVVADATRMADDVTPQRTDVLPTATSTPTATLGKTGTLEIVSADTATEVATATGMPTLTATRRPSTTPSPAPTANSVSSPTATAVPPTAVPPSAVPPTAIPLSSRTPTPTRMPVAVRLESCCMEKEVLPGQAVVFEVSLTNIGRGRESFDVWLNKALPGNWQGMFCIGTVCYLQGTVVVELDAGASQAIEVKVRAADDAISGNQGYVTLGVASQSDASVRRTLGLRTSVVAPTPTVRQTPTASETAVPSATATESRVPTATCTEEPLATTTATEQPTPGASPTATEVPVPSPTTTEPPAPSATAADSSLTFVAAPTLATMPTMTGVARSSPP